MSPIYTFDDFIKSEPLLCANRWFEFDTYRAYVRMRHRVICGKSLLCCDLANIEVYPSYRRTGILSSFIQHLLHTTVAKVVYVENVLEKEQYGIYERRNFTRETAIGGTVSFYQFTKHYAETQED